MTSRSFFDRLQDRLWTVRLQREALDLPSSVGCAAMGGSISGEMAWPQACAALADGLISSEHFRRFRAVVDVVETLGPCDGRHHARLIRAAGHEDWLEDVKMLDLSSWGDPMLWPNVLLGVPHAMAPTSLRYLSHALWLRDQGLIPDKGRVVEIGVGYGGLAGVNALVSDTKTTLVDLPDVERAAMRMLRENDLQHAAIPSAQSEGQEMFDCVISNYAFTELSIELQDEMLTKYIARSRHGMILSNAEVFSQQIGGRSNDQILSALRAHGVTASYHAEHPLFSPADRATGSVLFVW
ncbi:MAG: hypothetical protein EAZ81_12670 [Verrucomicrobia bacterium]|nr:MAG: hypothetical protein EAZ81_12670 [Verrucomicrobiota bacterium]